MRATGRGLRYGYDAPARFSSAHGKDAPMTLHSLPSRYLAHGLARRCGAVRCGHLMQWCANCVGRASAHACVQIRSVSLVAGDPLGVGFQVAMCRFGVFAISGYMSFLQHPPAGELGPSRLPSELSI